MTVLLNNTNYLPKTRTVDILKKQPDQSVCYFDKHFVNFRTDNQQFIEKRKRKVFAILKHFCNGQIA